MNLRCTVVLVGVPSICSLGGRVCVRCLVGFSGCDVSPVYLCSCVSLDNCHAVVGGEVTQWQRPPGPCPLCSVPAHWRGVFLASWVPSPSPLLNSTTDSGAPPPHCREGALALVPYCSGLRGLPRPSRPVFTFHSAPLPLVAWPGGIPGASPTLSAPPWRRHPTLRGFPGPHWGRLRSPLPQRSLRRRAAAAEAGGRENSCSTGAGPRAIHQGGGAPDWPAQAPPPGRGHMRRRRRRRAPPRLCAVGLTAGPTRGQRRGRCKEKPPARAPEPTLGPLPPAPAPPACPCPPGAAKMG